MNRKLKIALSRRSSEQGFAIPVAMAMGLVMLLVGVTIIVKSQGDQITASAQQQTAQNLGTTETGITRLQAFLNKYPYFAKVPSTQWKDPDVLRRAADAYIKTVRCVTSPTQNTVKDEINKDLDSLLPGWKPVDANDSNKGEFRIKLDGYKYTAPNGILIIDGKNKQGAYTTLQVTIPIQEVFPIGTRPEKPPGLWVNISDLTKNQTVQGDLLLNSCSDDKNNPTNIDNTPSPTRESDIEPSTPPGSFNVNSLSRFPNLPPLPDVAPSSLPAKPTQNYYIDRYNPDSGIAQSLPSELPTADDIKNYPSGTQKDGSYAYRLGSITSDLKIAPDKTVVIYLTGDISLKGNTTVGDITAPNRLKIFGSQNGAYCPKNLPNGTAAGCNTNSIELNGTPEIDAFIYAPGATAGVKGGGNSKRFQGAIWVKKWEMDSKSNKVVVTQTISSWYDWDDFTWDGAWVTDRIAPISLWQRQEASP